MIGSCMGHGDDGGVEQRRLDGNEGKGVVWSGSSGLLDCCYRLCQPKMKSR